MAWIYFLIVSLSLCVQGAPPSPGLGHYRSQPIRQSSGSPYQPANSLDYYFNDPSAARYYNEVAQKQVNENKHHDSAKLENLDPKTEVELLPGVQPQQPPQQSPVAPNIPGLLPGQQVYIVHMPVPGYRPGTLGGYQPVYIVGAGASENNNVCNANGYQNTILVDPSTGQPVYSPFGYQRGLVPNPGLQPSQYGYLHTDPAYGYQQGLQGPSPSPAYSGLRNPLRLAQLVSLQGQQHPLPSSIQGSLNEAPGSRVVEQSNESNESSEGVETRETRDKARTSNAPEHRSKM